LFDSPVADRHLPSFPTRRSSDLRCASWYGAHVHVGVQPSSLYRRISSRAADATAGSPRNSSGCSRSTAPTLSVVGTRTRPPPSRSEEHTSELQSRENLVCRLLLE